MGTPLIISIIHQSYDISLFLLERGADIHRFCKDGNVNAFSAANARENIDLIKEMLSRGADVNQGEGEKTITPLISSMTQGNNKLARFLLENGAHVNGRNVDKKTALIVAIQQGPGRENMERLEILLEFGADLEVVDKDGFSPLGLAAFFGLVDTVKFLIKNGANVNPCQIEKKEKKKRKKVKIMSEARIQ